MPLLYYMHCSVQIHSQCIEICFTIETNIYLHFIHYCTTDDKSLFSASPYRKGYYALVTLLTQPRLAQSIVPREVHNCVIEQFLSLYRFIHWSGHNVSFQHQCIRKYKIVLVHYFHCSVSLERNVSKRTLFFFNLLTTLQPSKYCRRQ